jgi:hypothetical protein
MAQKAPTAGYDVRTKIFWRILNVQNFTVDINYLIIHIISAFYRGKHASACQRGFTSMHGFSFENVSKSMPSQIRLSFSKEVDSWRLEKRDFSTSKSQVSEVRPAPVARPADLLRMQK